MTNISRNKPGLSITLEEIRLEYDREEARLNSIENKAGILIAFIGIMVPFSLLFFDYMDQSPLVIVYIFYSISALISIIILWPKTFTRPNENVQEFYAYTNYNQKNLMDLLIINYMKAIEENEKIITRYAFFQFASYFFAMASIVLMALLLL